MGYTWCTECALCTDVRHGPADPDADHCTVACPLEGGMQRQTETNAERLEYTDVSDSDHPDDYYTTVRSNQNGQVPPAGPPHGSSPRQTIARLQSLCSCALQCPFGGHRCRLGCCSDDRYICSHCYACSCGGPGEDGQPLASHCAVVCPHNDESYDGTPRPLAAQAGRLVCLFVYLVTSS